MVSKLPDDLGRIAGEELDVEKQIRDKIASLTDKLGGIASVPPSSLRVPPGPSYLPPPSHMEFPGYKEKGIPGEEYLEDIAAAGEAAEAEKVRKDAAIRDQLRRKQEKERAEERRLRALGEQAEVGKLASDAAIREQFLRKREEEQNKERQRRAEGELAEREREAKDAAAREQFSRKQEEQRKRAEERTRREREREAAQQHRRMSFLGGMAAGSLERALAPGTPMAGRLVSLTQAAAAAGQGFAGVGGTLGAIGTAAGAAAAPIAFIAALAKGAQLLADWSNKLSESNLQLAEFSGSMRAVLVESQMRQHLMAIQRGQQLAPSARNLEQSRNDFMQALQPITTAASALLNDMMADLTKTITFLTEWNPIFILIRRVCEWFLENQDDLLEGPTIDRFIRETGVGNLVQSFGRPQRFGKVHPDLGAGFGGGGGDF